MDLGYTKRGKRKGVREFVVLDEPCTAAVLKAALAHSAPNTLLVHCSPATWRYNVNRYAEAAGLQGFGIKPYSLRRGGATAFFVHTGSLSLALERGRWNQSATARIHLTEGRVVAQNFAVPQDLRQRLEARAAIWQW